MIKPTNLNHFVQPLKGGIMQAKKYVIIDWQPSRQARLSLVDQIVSYFKQQVSKGNWLCGDHIPSQRELATVFSVNRSTIVTALSILSADGIIESTVGRGTIISNNSWSFLFQKLHLTGTITYNRAFTNQIYLQFKLLTSLNSTLILYVLAQVRYLKY